MSYCPKSAEIAEGQFLFGVLNSIHSKKLLEIKIDV